MYKLSILLMFSIWNTARVCLYKCVESKWMYRRLEGDGSANGVESKILYAALIIR